MDVVGESGDDGDDGGWEWIFDFLKKYTRTTMRNFTYYSRMSTVVNS